MRILLVYGHEPSGHASAARALEARARALGHDAQRLAIDSHYHPILGGLLAAVYLGIIRNLPGFWRYLYDNRALQHVVRGLRRVYLVGGGRRIRSELKLLAPDIIVCTHAAPLGFLVDARARGVFQCPIAAVVTDFGVHGYWLRPRADLYCVASEEAARFVRDHDVPARSVHATGIPILGGPVLDRAAARSALGAAPDTRVILLSGGSRGLGLLPQMARSLLENLTGVLILAVCGNNGKLQRLLQERHAGDRRFRTLPQRSPEQMRELMAAADLAVGKAGGLTVAECLAQGLPLVVVDPISGQEERNAAFLERSGAAVRAVSPAALGKQVRALLSDAPGLAAMRAAAASLGRPASAQDAMQAILGGLSRSHGRPEGQGL